MKRVAFGAVLANEGDYVTTVLLGGDELRLEGTAHVLWRAEKPTSVIVAYPSRCRRGAIVHGLYATLTGLDVGPAQVMTCGKRAYQPWSRTEDALNCVTCIARTAGIEGA